MKSITSDSIFAGIIILLAALIIINSTRGAVTQAKDTKVKSDLYELKQSVDYLINSKTNLLSYFTDCNAPDIWCKTNEAFVKSTFLNPDSLEQILPYVMKDGTGNFYRLQATDKDGYIISGQSAKHKSRCWVISSDKTKTNLSNSLPSACL